MMRSVPPSVQGDILRIEEQNWTISTHSPSSSSPNNGSACEVCKIMESISTEFVVFQLVFPAVILIANSITCLAIYRAYQLKECWRLSLLNLSITDVMASLLYIYQITFAWTEFEINYECIVRYALFVGSTIVTLTTISFMTCDKFAAIFLPYIYQTLTSHRMYIFAAIGSCWFVAAGNVGIGFGLVRWDAEGCFYPLLIRPEIHLMYGVSGLLHIIGLVVMNAIIFAYARIHIAKIAATLVGEERDKQVSRLGLKSALTTVAVVVPYVLTNAPLYILMIYFYIDIPFTHTHSALFIVNAFSSLSLVNSLLNPLIYVWRVKPVRVEIKRMGYQIANIFTNVDYSGSGTAYASS